MSENKKIKLIIEVDEKLVCEGFERPFTEEERNILIRTIGNGTPLPKGHGRLVDADEEIKYARKWIKHPNQYISQRNKDFIYYLEKAETVIPADNEVG